MLLLLRSDETEAFAPNRVQRSVGGEERVGVTSAIKQRGTFVKVPSSNSTGTTLMILIPGARHESLPHSLGHMVSFPSLRDTSSGPGGIKAKNDV